MTSWNDSLECKINLLSEMHNSKEFLLSSVSKHYDLLIQRFYETGDKKKAGQTYLHKADFLLNSCRDPNLAYDVYTKVVDLFAPNIEPEVREIVEGAYEEILSLLNVDDEKFISVEKAYASYMLGNKLDDGVIDVVFDACGHLEKLEKFDDALSLYEALLSKIDASASFAERRLSALLSKGICLEFLDRAEEAIHILTDVLLRAENDDDWHVAQALTHLGALFAAIDRHAHALAHFDEVILRYGENKEMEAIVAQALFDKAKFLRNRDENAAAVTIYDDLIRRHEKNQERQDILAWGAIPKSPSSQNARRLRCRNYDLRFAHPTARKLDTNRYEADRWGCNISKGTDSQLRRSCGGIATVL